MDFFVHSLFTAGLACVVGAIVGGGLKAFGIELPLLASKARQVLLGVVGAGMIGLALILGIRLGPATPPEPSLAAGGKPPTASSPPERAFTGSPTALAAAEPTLPQAPPTQVAEAPSPGCPSPDQALDCLPRGSRAVAFADLRAANAAAWANVRNGLSTSQAEAESIRRGASGRAARLCGIMESNDSSPLALHLAAVKLKGAAGSEGAIDRVCDAVIEKLL